MKWMRRFCVGAMFLLALANSPSAAEPRRVLLLHSFGPYFAPWNTITPRFSEELRKRSPNPIDLYEASVQAERFSESPSAEEGPFIEYLNALFRARDLRLIVAMGGPATRFVLRNRAQLFPSSPLLIASSDVRTYSDLTLTANDTSCPTLYDLRVQIEHILQILPDTTHIVLATGVSPAERFRTDLIRQSLQHLSPRVTFEWLTNISAEDMVKRVAELPPRSAIHYTTVRVDGTGVPQEGDVLLFRFIEVGRAPIFTHVDSHFGKGVVGGPMFSSNEIAQKCAEVSVRILNGEIPGDIKVPPLGLATPVYDWRQLHRWHISESVLPSGSTVFFRQPTAWDQYRHQILLAAFAILLQAALISWLLFERRRRHRAEIAVRDTMSNLAHVNRRATAGELTASIAHEVNQPLTGIVANANAGIRWLATATPDIGRAEAAFKQIVTAGHHASNVIATVRALFKPLAENRSRVQINDLIHNALSLERIEMERRQVSVRLDLSEGLPDVLGDRVQLLQVILNLTRNAVEAMTPDRPSILHVKSQVDESGDVLVLVEDSGTGIDKQNLTRIFDPLFTTKQQGMGIGLSICKSIIESHHGRLWVTSTIGEGSRVFVKLPRYKTGDEQQSSGATSHNYPKQVLS
jgi:signal transduction histidine kinase